MQEKKIKKITFALSCELLEKIQEKADAENRSVSDYIRLTLEKSIKNNYKCTIGYYEFNVWEDNELLFTIDDPAEYIYEDNDNKSKKIIKARIKMLAEDEVKYFVENSGIVYSQEDINEMQKVIIEVLEYQFL